MLTYLDQRCCGDHPHNECPGRDCKVSEDYTSPVIDTIHKGFSVCCSVDHVWSTHDLVESVQYVDEHVEYVENISTLSYSLPISTLAALFDPAIVCCSTPTTTQPTQSTPPQSAPIILEPPLPTSSQPPTTATIALTITNRIPCPTLSASDIKEVQYLNDNHSFPTEDTTPFWLDTTKGIIPTEDLTPFWLDATRTIDDFLNAIDRGLKDSCELSYIDVLDDRQCNYGAGRLSGQVPAPSEHRAVTQLSGHDLAPNERPPRKKQKRDLSQQVYPDQFVFPIYVPGFAMASELELCPPRPCPTGNNVSDQQVYPGQFVFPMFVPGFAMASELELCPPRPCPTGNHVSDQQVYPDQFAFPILLSFSQWRRSLYRARRGHARRGITLRT
jgi:hypothetical protein